MKGASLALAFAAALSLLAVTPARAARTIEYLYIDASEGGGSGGHVAIALGERVFHFEYQAGILRLARESIETVRHRYGVFENRTILVSHVPVSEETFGLVLDELTLRYLVQQQHLADHLAIVDDRRLLEGALSARRGQPAEHLMLDGAGFFFDAAVVPASEFPQVSDGDRQARTLVALRERLDAVLGPDSIARMMRRVGDDLSGLTPDPAPAEASAPLLADQLGPARNGIAQRYRDAALALLALEALRTARPLRPGSEITGKLPELGPGDVEIIDRLEDALRESLVRMVQSKRPDWGFPLLLGMARLIALDETRRTGRWVVLDALPVSAGVIERERFLGHPDTAHRLRARVASDFDTALARLRARASAGTFPEAEFAELEATGSRFAEVENALRESRDLRVAWGTIVPARGAPQREPILPALADQDLDAAIAVARQRETEHAAEIPRLYGYNLVTRNCVTEIFRTIDAALARDVLSRQPTLDTAGIPARVRAASVERLGGHVDPGASVNFIPAASADSVQSTYAVSRVEELPSYRKTRLALMYKRENPVWVYLRESNTLTSTLYRRTHEDSAFLFFTDDAIPVRPVLGALNFLTGVGAAAAGLAMLPIDGGDLLKAGLRGVLFSLPELAFFNIRKGSFPDFTHREIEEGEIPSPRSLRAAKEPGG